MHECQMTNNIVCFFLDQGNDEKGRERDEITHFHFAGWPNYGLPQDCGDLATFVELVSKHQARPGESGAPMVVHCSGGLGRSGSSVFCIYDS